MYGSFFRSSPGFILNQLLNRQSNAIRLTIVLLIALLSNVSFLRAETLFKDNFDEQPDWRPTGGYCIGVYHATNCPDKDIPAGWTYYNNVEIWNPLKGYPNKQYGERITSEEHRGATGKSWIKSSESSYPSGEANYYSDSILMKVFPQVYPELYVSFWIKFDSGWQWAPQSAQLKLTRIGHFDGGDTYTPGLEPFHLSSTGKNAPLYIFDLYNAVPWGWKYGDHPRCDPQETEYLDCGESSYYNHWDKSYLFDCQQDKPCTGFVDSKNVQHPAFEDNMGDGQWHHIELHVKINSAPGVGDGVFETWLDGVQLSSANDVTWLMLGANAKGFNFVSIGGNWNNWYSDPKNQAEQEYAIDDFVISTTRIGLPPAPLPPSNINSKTIP